MIDDVVVTVTDNDAIVRVTVAAASANEGSPVVFEGVLSRVAEVPLES